MADCWDVKRGRPPRRWAHYGRGRDWRLGSRVSPGVRSTRLAGQDTTHPGCRPIQGRPSLGRCAPEGSGDLRGRVGLLHGIEAVGIVRGMPQGLTRVGRPTVASTKLHARERHRYQAAWFRYGRCRGTGGQALRSRGWMGDPGLVRRDFALRGLSARRAFRARHGEGCRVN